VVTSQQYPFWPGSGAITETGVAEGEGTTVNIPVPAGTGDTLATLYARVLPPLTARFRPDAVFVSAGYDAHWMDPLGGLTLSVEGLASIVRVIAEVADAHAGGRVIASLEGGYHAGALAAGVAATMGVMEDGGAHVDDPFGPAPSRGSDLVRVTEALVALHGL
jgi:acetoin utilization deacetylase AcuC-like enzyme